MRGLTMTHDEYRAHYDPIESPDLPYQAWWYTGTTYHADGYERGGWYATEAEALDGAIRGKQTEMAMKRVIGNRQKTYHIAVNMFGELVIFVSATEPTLWTRRYETEVGGDKWCIYTELPVDDNLLQEIKWEVTLYKQQEDKVGKE